MSGDHLAELEKTLLYISEAREHAERTGRSIKRAQGDQRLVDALDEADRALLAVHGELMRTAYFPGASSDQLKLAG